MIITTEQKKTNQTLQEPFLKLVETNISILFGDYVKCTLSVHTYRCIKKEKNILIKVL